MISSLDILNQRIMLLERTYIGSRAGAESTADIDVVARIESLHSRFQELECDIPAFKSCYESVLKLRPMLLEKKGAAVLISQRLEGLLAQKDDLHARAKTILKIDDLSKVIDDTLKGIYFSLLSYYSLCLKEFIFFTVHLSPEILDRFSAVEETIAQLKQDVKATSQELDELLNVYEQAVSRYNV